MRSLTKNSARTLWLSTPILALLLAAATTQSKAQLPAGTRDASSSNTPSVDPLQAQANEALDKRDYPTALKLLTTLAGKNPTDAHILFDLASTQDALDQNAAATETYKKAIAADPKFFEPHLALALLLGREGQTKEAHAQLDIAVTLEAPDPALKARAYRTLARIDQRTDPALAATNLIAALKISPETADDILLSAELAEASNDFTAAEAAYRRLLKVTPNDPAATAALAHIFLRQNKPEAAEPILLAALAAHPDGPAAMPLNAQLAAVRMASTDPSKSAQALPALRQLHKDEPNNASITRILARLYNRTGDYTNADQLFSQLLAAVPAGTEPDPTLLDDKADALIHLKHPAEAEALLKRAIANQSAFPSKDDLAVAAGHLAFAASQNNDPKTTLQALSISATLQPQSPSSLFLAATAHDKLHEVKIAIDLYKQFLSVANGQFPDEEWEARHRLIALDHQK